MSVKDTLYFCLIKYSTIFENKWQVYHHLFSVYGNGYKWVDGELVEMLYDSFDPKIHDPETFDGELPTLEKLGINEGEIPERVLKESEDFTPIFHTWFPDRLEENRRKFAEEYYEHYCSLQDRLDLPKKSRDEYINFNVNRKPEKRSILSKDCETEREYLLMTQSFTYSYVYRYPDDMKPDWAVARQEWEDYLKSMDAFLEDDFNYFEWKNDSKGIR